MPPLVVCVLLFKLAYLSAKRFGLERLVFAGNFLRHNDLTMKALAFSIEYWSKSSMQAAFLKHEGYFGACGGLMTETEHFEPSTPYNPSENLKMPTGRRRHSITRSPQIKRNFLFYFSRQNPTSGGVAFSGFSAVFPTPTYGVVFKMP